MNRYTEILRKEFPAIDNEMQDYVGGVLEGSQDDFDTCDDIFDAVGDILQSINMEKSEDSIRDLCQQFLNIMKADAKYEEKKVLNAPMNIAEMAKSMASADKDVQSIWVVNKDNVNVSANRFHLVFKLF